MVRETHQAVAAGLKPCTTFRSVAQAFRSVAQTARLAITFTALALVAVATLHAQAPATTVKLASIVPTGSVFDKNLKQMAEEWKEATGGRVTVTVFSGGSQGDEPTVVRKMRLDALQAAAFTAVGLGSIDWAFNVFDIPFFFDSYDELNYVTDKLTPVLRKRMEAKGFVLMNWGNAGWTQIFSKKPVATVDDLKHVKLWTSAGNDKQVQWFKANGFEPRAMATTDILTGLTTGMLEGLPTTPLILLCGHNRACAAISIGNVDDVDKVIFLCRVRFWINAGKQREQILGARRHLSTVTKPHLPFRLGRVLMFDHF